jgi:hypothetical protein
MNRAEIESALQAAFIRCEREFTPLSEVQKQILLQIVVEELSNGHPQAPELNSGVGMTRYSVDSAATSDQNAQENNPLDELTSQERQALLAFVSEQEQKSHPWKIKLLNDWLLNRNSGSVQFLRDRYGPQWLNRVKPVHLAQYLEQQTNEENLTLKVGDRIEVSNGLWEWVQDDGPCPREWFPCTVIGTSEDADRDCRYHNCVIRFDNGAEFEIQGIYQWNRYNWRWSGSDA